jgi:parallel beta-helix repeat protein
VALCAAAGAIAATAGSAQAATIIVNPGQSIQAAVDAANPGDTVLVRPGNYHEEVLIQKDRIKLQGSMATISPPPVSSSPCGSAGVCVAGDVDFDTGQIFSYVHGVTVTGFLITGFDDFGIVAFAATNSTFTNNHTTGNGEYGITAFSSTATTIANNVTEGSGEAGIYVGDSPDSRVSVHDNFAQHNTFGVLYRNSGGGSITHNTLSHNCTGLLVLADAPGPASAVTIQTNTVNGNSAFCFSDDAGPVSGAGIVLAGADHSIVRSNNVQFNVPSDFSVFQGGIVLVSGPAGTPASHNTITGNTALHNSPDLYWDGFGVNTFSGNHCQTSVPSSLCH